MMSKTNYTSTHNVKYINSTKDFEDKILDLEKKYPNDQDLGKEVRKYIKNKNIINFPGIQNL